MEDISRELEREIARAKPTPHKTSRKKKVLVVDDYGEMRSGTYLSVLVRFLAGATLVFGLAAAGFYYLYGEQARENTGIKKKLAALEKKAEQLTSDKELLMARLVMAGEKPLLAAADTAADQPPPAETKTKKTEMKKNRPEEASPDQQPAPVLEDKPPADTAPAVPDVEPEGPSVSMSVENEAASTQDDGDIKADGPKDTETIASRLVAVEKFSVTRASGGQELRVRFDIRNIKEGPGEISGRIFLVLKPEAGTASNWIVVPKAPLAPSGIPSVYKRGQYFSISRFKPVKFTINSPANPGSLKTAAVYIFSDDGGLIYEDVMAFSLEEDS